MQLFTLEGRSQSVNRTARRVALAAVALACIVPVAACAQTTPLQQAYPAADGVNADRNGMALRNTIVIAPVASTTEIQRGGEDSVIVSIINRSGRDDKLMGVRLIQGNSARVGVLPSAGAPIKADKALHFGSDSLGSLRLAPIAAPGGVASRDLSPLLAGTSSQMRFTFANAGNIDLTVPVTTADGYYEDVTPALIS